MFLWTNVCQIIDLAVGQCDRRKEISQREGFEGWHEFMSIDNYEHIIIMIVYTHEYRGEFQLKWLELLSEDRSMASMAAQTR